MTVHRIRRVLRRLGGGKAETPQAPAKTPAERAIAAALKELERGAGVVVAGPWPDGGVSELLVWIPFLREVVARGAVASEDLVAVVRPGAELWYAGVAKTTTETPPAGRELPAALVLALLEDVRADRAPVKALSSRLRYQRPPTAGDQARYDGPWGEAAARSLTLGHPTVAIATAKVAASTEIDLASRAARSLDGAFALVASDAIIEADAFLRPAG